MVTRKKLGPDPRNRANVEAEKGETVLTNLSRGQNNIVEFYSIGGKKHTENGTPLSLPTNDRGTGASFIFSDQLKVEDPAILELFGSKGGKAKTYAELSKKHVSIINDSKALLLDPKLDPITQTSAEKNIETSRKFLQELQILQESHKGFPDGIPSGTESYFNEMGIRPEQLVELPGSIDEMAKQAEQKAMGGLVRKHGLPKYSDGGPLEEFGSKDNNAKIQYIYIKDVLGKDEGFKKALFEEYQKIQKDKDYYGKGYSKLLNDDKSFSKFELKTPQEVYDAYLKMQERNLIFKSQGYNVASTENDPSKNVIVPELSKKHGVPLPGMDGVVKEQIAYKAFENLSKNRDSYSDDLKKVLQPFSAVQFGSNDDTFKGQPSYVSLADGAYTNTSAGQISNFEAQKINSDVSKTLSFDSKSDADNVDDASSKGKYVGIDKNKQALENPLGYRSQDIRNLNRALSSAAGIRRYDPYMTTPKLNTLDAAYYSPERAIAAIMEAANSAEDVSKNFSDAQGAAASAASIAGSAFTSTADVISNYADKNVGLFNNVAQANSEMASRQNTLDAQSRNQLYDDNVLMDEKFRSALEVAKDKIVQMKNAAETNMSNLYNMNLLTEQFKTDPTTGLTYFTNGKDLEPSTAQDSKDVADELNDFMKKVPGLSPETAAKVFIASKSGKVQMKEGDGILTADDL